MTRLLPLSISFSILHIILSWTFMWPTHARHIVHSSLSNYIPCTRHFRYYSRPTSADCLRPPPIGLDPQPITSTSCLHCLMLSPHAMLLFASFGLRRSRLCSKSISLLVASCWTIAFFSMFSLFYFCTYLALDACTTTTLPVGRPSSLFSIFSPCTV